MRRQLRIATLVLLLTGALPAPAGTLVALCYHDVQDRPAAQRVGDAITISTAELVAQFAWLREHGWRPVSVDDILADRAGTRPLPEKAVLLSFDDGYASTYTRVFPLLKLFDYPAVVAPLVSWIEQPPGASVDYGSLTVARGQFLTWKQMREMAASGLVEIASHSYDLHHGVRGNPQGNEQPAGVTRVYDAGSGAYESDADYAARVRADLRRSSELIAHRLGRRPRVVVWPYGRYNQALIDIAGELGMPVTLALGATDAAPRSSSAAPAIARVLMGDGATLSDLVTTLEGNLAPAPVRVAHVDLDAVYDPDPGQQERNLDRLLDRIKALRINTVYLQAFADPDGDGNADALYFPNRHLPLRADLFNRVAWQLATRCHVRVYAWLPVLSYVLDSDRPLVASAAPAEASAGHYRRLSPFDPQALAPVRDIYEDLARYASFDGLLFQDDAYLSDYEDAGPAALRAYAERYGLPPSIASIRAYPTLFRHWTEVKTKALIAWTRELSATVRRYRPEIKTARNLYAEPVMNPAAVSWYAQSLDTFLDNYDYAVLMAMPYMENARDPEDWLRRLAARVAARPGALDRTVFELQSVDWRSGAPVAATRLARQMQLLQRLGVRSFGYYPDDFVAARPDLATLRAALSLSTYPYEDQP